MPRVINVSIDQALADLQSAESNFMKFMVMVFAGEGSLQELLRIFLKLQGHEVQVFRGIRTCPVYKNFREEKCNCPMERPCADLLLIDSDTSDINALHFLSLLQRRGCKALAANKAVISANNSAEFVRAVKELGCHYIAKPFHLNELKEWVEQATKRVATSQTSNGKKPNG